MAVCSSAPCHDSLLDSAAGLIGKLRANPTGVKLSDYASKLLPELEEETGMATGWRQCGSINIARTPGRVTALRRSMAMAHGFCIEARIMPLDEVKERYPIMNTDDVLEAMWMPEDATANATDICMAFAKGADTMKHHSDRRRGKDAWCHHQRRSCNRYCEY